jgi:predicted acetyltransferase
MAGSEPVLLSPAANLETAFCEMNDEFGKRGDSQYREFSSFEELLHNLETDEHEATRSTYVPMSVYWLVDLDGRILGEMRFRHYLNEALEQEGGHIGYHIRPSERGKGYGTSILRAALEVARERGLERVLVTCDTDNIPSARIIERNGGILSSQGISANSGNRISRYWIEL